MHSVAARLRRRPPRALIGCGLLLGALPVLAGSGAASERPTVRPAAMQVTSPVLAASDSNDLAWLDRLDLARLRRAAVGRAAATTGLPTDVLPTTTSGATPAAPPRISVGGIPPVVLAAYRSAAASLARTDPSCHLGWSLLAGIGRVESNHGAAGGSGRAGWDGNARPPILGPVLDGTGGSAAIADTDGGRLDGNTRWDRAVGPMQFLPGTWRLDGRDGNGDGRKDPENISDAALAAGGYLCAGGGDLRKQDGLAAAVFSYNHSLAYVRLVLTLAAGYANGGTASVSLPAAATTGPSTTPSPTSRPSAAASPRPTPTGTSPQPTAEPTGTPSPSPTTPSPTTPSPTTPSPTTPSPTTPGPSGPAWTVTIGTGTAIGVDPVAVTGGVPQLPPLGEVGWWPKSSAPGGHGTTVLMAPAGTAAHPGPLDLGSLPVSTRVTLRMGSSTATYRVVGAATSATLPAPSGPRLLLLVSWTPGGTPLFTVVRATPR